MFSVKQKRDIADAVQQILRATNHPELPKGEIVFSLHVQGAEDWSWADIRNNGAVANPTVNPYFRDLIREARQLRAFVNDLADVGGEERRGPYSAEAKWDNVKRHAALLVQHLEGEAQRIAAPPERTLKKGVDDGR